MEFLSYLINGISLGSVYAIIALGYTMVYGIAKMQNFAHGDVIMVGSCIVFIAVNQMGMPPLLAIIISMALCTLLGIVIERFAYKPLRSAPFFVGGSDHRHRCELPAAESGAADLGADPKSFTSVVGLAPVQLAGGRLVISGETIVTIVVSAVIMAGLIFFVNNTKMGRAMLAVSEDKGAAQLMGINVNATIAMTFAIGSALAAVGWCAAVFGLSHSAAHHRRHAWHQGLHCCGIRRYRLHSRRFCGRHPAGRDRDHEQGLHFHPAGGCHRVCSADYCAAGASHRSAGQENQ